MWQHVMLCVLSYTWGVPVRVLASAVVNNTSYDTHTQALSKYNSTHTT